MKLLYLLASVAVCGVCFYMTDLATGIIAAVICAMCLIFRCVGDAAVSSRLRRMTRRAKQAWRGEDTPSLPEGKRGAMHELDCQVYKLALKLSDCRSDLARCEEEHTVLLRGIAGHLIQRAEELPANVHRRELIALAHDLEELASLPDAPVPAEEIVPTTAEEVWHDAATMAEETLRLQQITVHTEIGARAYVTTCPRAALADGLRGLLETCARHADVGSSWTCSAKETAVYTEFRISSDRFDWNAQEFASLFDGDLTVEPALICLARLAALYSGETRTERTDGQMCHMIFRLYKATR